jgi:hypothetical protein
MNHTSAKAQRPRMLVRSLVLVVDPSFSFLTDFYLLLSVACTTAAPSREG